MDDPGELRLVELDTGHNEPLLPGLANRGAAWDWRTTYLRTARQVVAAAKDSEGKLRLWLAALDGQSPPRQIPNVEGDTPLFGKDGEIFFHRWEGASAYAYRVHEDGTGLRRLSEQTIVTPAGVSQDGQWLTATVAVANKAIPERERSFRDTFMALPVGEGRRFRSVGPAGTTTIWRGRGMEDRSSSRREPRLRHPA